MTYNFTVFRPTCL